MRRFLKGMGGRRGSLGSTKTSGLLACFAFFALVSLAMGKKGETRVLVDSFAEKSYLKKKDAGESVRRETYHMVEGKSHGGVIRDSSLREVPFIEVAEGLARELETRNYYPAQAKEAGDFVIIVHRGITRIEADWDELFPVDDSEEAAEESDDEEEEELTNPETYLREEGFSNAEQDNAQLIGFDRALKRRGLMPQDELELQEMLRSERYFLVLMAFDWQKIQKTGEKKLLWSTRFSMDAIGVGFDDAHFALSRGAANYFGTNLDGKLGKTKTFVGPGDVVTGDLEVIGTVDSEEE
ncbi:MAG: hypothetical protein ACI92G_001198 [Candidatus Pelagisphaera sp.]|jgi:hypothetical protein